MGLQWGFGEDELQRMATVPTITGPKVGLNPSPVSTGPKETVGRF